MEVQLKWDTSAFLNGVALGGLGYAGASRIQRIPLVRSKHTHIHRQTDTGHTQYRYTYCVLHTIHTYYIYFQKFTHTTIIITIATTTTITTTTGPWHLIGSMIGMGLFTLAFGNYQEATTKALARQKKLYVQRLREQTADGCALMMMMMIQY